MTSKTILITGATDGLGKALAINLAQEGHTLLLHGRSDRKLAETAKEIAQQPGNRSIRTYQADFASLESVRQMADQILQNEEHLDVLVNNAGMGAGKPTDDRALNENGYELRFTVNYLGTFLLTNLLLPLLKTSRQKANDIRIVNVASVGQRRLSFDDLMLENDYSGINAYSQSKLAMIMFSFDLADELKPFDIPVNAIHPATLMPTKMTIETFGYGMASIDQGMIATKKLVTNGRLKGITGKYFDGTHESQANGQAYEVNARQQLKAQSLELVGLIESTY